MLPRKLTFSTGLSDPSRYADSAFGRFRTRAIEDRFEHDRAAGMSFSAGERTIAHPWVSVGRQWIDASSQRTEGRADPASFRPRPTACLLVSPRSSTMPHEGRSRWDRIRTPIQDRSSRILARKPSRPCLDLDPRLAPVSVHTCSPQAHQSQPHRKVDTSRQILFHSRRALWLEVGCIPVAPKLELGRWPEQFLGRRHQSLKASMSSPMQPKQGR